MRILRDERLLDLAVAVVISASETAVEAKIRGLSRALAAGAVTPDDAVVDEQLLLVDALANLQSPHIQVLAQLAKPHPQGRTMRPPRAMQLQRPGWTVDEIVNALPGTRAVIERILCVLEAHGLAREVRSAIQDSASRCSITAAGVACMEPQGVLRAQASSTEP